MIKSIFQPFYTLFTGISFLISLLLAFPFFLLLGIKDSKAGRRIIWMIVHYWARIWLLLTGMPVRVSGYFPHGTKYVLVANHISYLDTLNIYAAIPEYFRTLARKEMAKIPVFGFVYKQLTILVDRSSSESRAKSMRLMWRQLKHECHITVFPEGGFNETEEVLKTFYDGAFRLAINTQTAILPVIFPDTVHRWHYSAWWKLWPGRNRAFFLEPIPVEGLTMEDLPLLKERVYSIMKAALIQYST